MISRPYLVTLIPLRPASGPPQRLRLDARNQQHAIESAQELLPGLRVLAVQREDAEWGD